MTRPWWSGWWWKPLPVVTRRERLWQRVLFASRALFLLFGILLVLDLASVIPPLRTRTFAGTRIPTFVFAMWAWIALDLTIRWRLRRALARGHELVQSAHVRICPHCQYNLQGLPDRAACPECGVWFGPESLHADWQEIYERLHRRARGR